MVRPSTKKTPIIQAQYEIIPKFKVTVRDVVCRDIRHVGSVVVTPNTGIVFGALNPRIFR